MSGHSVKVDVARQRIYLRLEGLLSDEQMTAAAHEFIAAVKKVKPGFTVINDISQLKVLSQFGTAEVKRASEAAVAGGMSVSVRVVGGSPTATMQFTRNAQNVGYSTGVAGSLEEAERMIDEATKG